MNYDSTKIDEMIVEEVKIQEEAELQRGPALNNGPVADPLLKGVIRVYQNSIPWQNRANITIASLGKILGVDYFIHPILDMALGIPKDTKVVLISSNSAGNKAAAEEQNLPKVQKSLEDFVRNGGVLIVDMADNLQNGGYIAPNSCGTPDLIFPDANEKNKLYLTPNSYCTSFVNGPTITLTKDNISMPPKYSSSAHGNLVDGIEIPARADVLMTAVFNGKRKPVLAYYYLGKGFVILDTITKEFYGQAPEGDGPTNIVTNLIYFAYHLTRITV